ncbi:2-amino-4-hydroxy-6-hydroxymethyldihydropteridine diphosphokinase [Alteromonadaceae bacterium M269]|nr:2-amino-4-hydroxy-6-hydroxymethyldihydropteridine diphosphokinase [Alteromonadaceae bacterium M269]
MASATAKKSLSYIGLGSNLEFPLAQLKRAVQAMNEHQEIAVISCSSFYQSKPMGPSDQPDYTNAVALLETTLEAHDLLSALQKIELEQGRVRKKEQWGPRTLDLDILLYDQECIKTERLTVPHYGMKEREFVLYPLAEIAPSLIFPDGQKLEDVLSQCPLNGLTKIEANTVNLNNE